MSFRRDRGVADAQRRWTAFLDRHRDLIQRTTLPRSVLASEEHLDDFLQHGCLDHHPDPTRTTVDQLDEPGYQALCLLVAAYLEEGYPMPVLFALRDDDRRAIEARFGST